MPLEYLTRAQIGIFLIEKELPLDQTNNNLLDEVKIESVIPFVRQEIEPYLKEAGYIVPLTEQSSIDQLTYISVPIYKFHITNSNGMRTKQTEEDYNNAKSRLNKIAKGDINLDIPKEEDGSDSEFLGVLKMDIL